MGNGCSSFTASINSSTHFSSDSGCDKSAGSIIDAVNSIVSTAITKTINNCFVDQVAKQLVRIKCKPKLPEGVTVYEENFACGNCIDNIKNSANYQNNLQRNLWKSSPASVRQPIDTFYQGLLDQMEGCGLIYCKSCALNNVTQLNLINSDAECIETSMTKVNIQSNLTTLLQQQLLSNQDLLSSAATTLGIQNVQTLSEFISSNISTVVNDQFITDLRQTLKQSQIVELISDSSVSLSNISQSSVITVTTKFVSDAHVATMAFAQETFDSIAQLAQSQNTLNDVGNVVIDSSVGFLKAMDTAVGEITLAIVVLLGVVVLGVVGFLAYQNIKRVVDERTKRKLITDDIFVATY
jgi:hypothetical protein